MRSHSSQCNTLHIVDILLHLPARGMEAKGSNQEPRVSHKNRRRDLPVVVISLRLMDTVDGNKLAWDEVLGMK